MTNAPAPSPDALLARYRATGAPADLGALFDATAADLFRVAVAAAPDAPAAEDAVQETFLAVISAAARWDPARRAMPWLLGILRFKVAHERAKAGRTRGRPRDPRADAGEEPAAALDAEAATRAWAEIEGLEEPYRSVALLRWRYGLSPAEIAHVRGEAPGTTRSLLSRALDRARRLSRAAPAVLLPAPPEGRGLTAVREVVLAAAAASRPAPAPPLAPPRGVAALAGALAVIAGGVVLVHLGRAGPVEAPPAAGAARPPTAVAASGDGSPALAAPPGGRSPASPRRTPRPTARGRVVDEAGRPIEGARVLSVPRESPGFVVPAGFGGAPTAADGATTDADGRFEVELDADEPTHEVFVASEGRGVAVVGPIRPGSDTRIVLSAGATWRGRVVDGAGRPVAGARVTALVLCSWFRLEPGATTDAEGRFAFPGMPARTRSLRLFRVWFEARAEGLAPTTVKVGPLEPPGERDVEIVLRRGSRWGGRVLDGDTGRPVAGARVALESKEAGVYFGTELDDALGRPARTSPFDDRPVAETTSDAEGRWTLDRLPCLDGVPPPAAGEPDDRPIVGRLVARAEGYAPCAEAPRRVAEGAEATLDLTLWRAGAVTGRVVREDGRPVAGARGFVGTQGRVRAGARFVTDAAGRYRVDSLPTPTEEGADASVGLLRFADGSSAAKVGVRLRARETVTAPDLVAVPPRDDDWIRVPVRVVSESGAALGRALASWSGSLQATDPEGRATLLVPRRALARQPEVEIRARAEGWAPSAVRLRAADLGTEEVRIVLSPGKTLAGRVTWADGRPVAGAYVTAVPAVPPPALEGEDPGSRPPPGVFTEADGTFRHEDLPEGEWVLSTTAPSRTPRPDAPTASAGPVRAGATDVVLRFATAGWEAGVPVRGSVVDAETGAGVPRAFLRWTRGATEVCVIADGKGKFDLEVPHGEWRVQVSATGFRRGVLPEVRVEARSDPLRIDVPLSRGGTITGVVTGVEIGEDGPRELWLAGTEEGGAVVPVGRDGRYRVTGLEPGTYLGSWGDPKVPDEGPVEAYAAAGLLAVPDGDATIDVRLVPAGVLSVATGDPALPMAGAPPSASPPEARERAASTRWVVTDAAGRVLLRRGGAMRGRSGGLDRLVLPPGRYRVTLERPDAPPVTADVDVAAGQHAKRTLGAP